MLGALWVLGVLYQGAAKQGAGRSNAACLEAVKGHVKAMHEMIEQAKQEEIDEARQATQRERPLFFVEFAQHLKVPFGG